MHLLESTARNTGEAILSAQQEIATQDEITEAIVGVRSLLSSYERFTKYYSAVDVNGIPTSALNKNADRFCLLGACTKVIFKHLENHDDAKCNLLYSRVTDNLRARANDLFEHKYGVACVNDQLGHNAVIELLDYTIAQRTESV